LDLVKIYNTNNIPEAAVLKSRMEAAGLHPFIQNFEHAQMAHIDILALGGMNVLVPESEVEEATAIIRDQGEGEFVDTDVFDEDYNPPWSRKGPFKAKLWPIITCIILAAIVVIFTRVYFIAGVILLFGAFLFHAQNKVTRLQSRPDKERQHYES